MYTSVIPHQRTWRPFTIFSSSFGSMVGEGAEATMIAAEWFLHLLAAAGLPASSLLRAASDHPCYSIHCARLPGCHWKLHTSLAFHRPDDSRPRAARPPRFHSHRCRGSPFPIYFCQAFPPAWRTVPYSFHETQPPGSAYIVSCCLTPRLPFFITSLILLAL